MRFRRLAARPWALVAGILGSGLLSQVVAGQVTAPPSGGTLPVALGDRVRVSLEGDRRIIVARLHALTPERLEVLPEAAGELLVTPLAAVRRFDRFMGRGRAGAGGFLKAAMITVGFSAVIGALSGTVIAYGDVDDMGQRMTSGAVLGTFGGALLALPVGVGYSQRTVDHWERVDLRGLR